MTVSDERYEQRLIRAGQRGDATALEVLFARYRHRLFYTALRVLRNSEDAEDALQDGMLCAYRHLDRFEGRSQFFTWLTRIVINAALMRRRKASSRPSVSLDETPRDCELPASERVMYRGPSPEQMLQVSEINKMIRQLSPILRTAFVLRHVQGYSNGEAANTLGVTQNTLKSRGWRARRQLVQLLGPCRSDCFALGAAAPDMRTHKIKRQTRSDRRNANALTHRLRPDPEIQLPRMNKDLAKLPVPIRVGARGQEINELDGERLFRALHRTPGRALKTDQPTIDVQF
jgi:RNA polymerase sigma-70 factor, ECF subfamily